MKQTHRLATVVLAAALGAGLAGEGAALASIPPEPSVPAAPARPQVAIDQYATGKVISHTRLAVRSRPTTHSKRQYWLKPGQKFQIKCWTRGQRIGDTRVWYRMGYSSPKDYVTAYYVKIIKGRVHRC
ncbi:hypothetical protein [Actinomadura sp. WMMA1423]|uniref:hypothetical protein n=1 Tax=Actinomadura sp. WMMA1423 TaxID=2591108 RepID=UPI0011474612|nr:hypothetical protein [Actinomadura sp. WMMA1423]